MSDDKMTESRPVDTVKVSVIGTGDASKLESGMVAVTPGANQPNLVMQVFSPVVAVAIRFGYDWVKAFLGTAVVGKMAEGGVPNLNVLQAAILSATVIALIGLLYNLATVFSGLEKKYPLLTGSV